MALQIPRREGAIWKAKRGRPRSCLGMPDEAIQKGAELVRCECRLRCSRWGAHWRHLAYMIEPSVRGGDAALCQIPLTTCSDLRVSRGSCVASVVRAVFTALWRRHQTASRAMY